MGNILVVLSHPDDESAVLSGTVAKLANDNDIYMLFATRGEAGKNGLKDSSENLANIRENEVKQCAQILGVKEVIFLDFKDGGLSNNNYHQLADEIKKYVQKLKPEILITFEPRGVTGHIDHIVVTMATTFVFYKSPEVQKLWYACFSVEQRAVINQLPEYFVYFPPGYEKSQIDIVEDISDVWEQKLEALKAHQSQAEDVENMLFYIQKSAKEEYFLELTKENLPKNLSTQVEL